MKSTIQFCFVFLLFFLGFSEAGAQKMVGSKYTLFNDDYIAKDFPMMVPRYKLIDDGNKIYVGARHGALYYYDPETLELKEKKVPIQEFFSQNLNLLNDSAGFTKKPYLHDIKDLVYYSEENGKAILLVEDIYHNRSKNIHHNTYYQLTWDLKENKIIKADVINKNTQEHYWSWEIDKKNPPAKGFSRTYKPINAVGYNPKKGTAYYMIWHWTTTYNGTSFSENPKKITEFVELKDGKIRSLAQLTYDKHNIGNYNFYHSESNTILAVEYWEGKVKNGYAYLIDAVSGKVRKIETPVNTYSAVFDPDMKRLYLQSVFRALWVVDLKSGNAIEKITTPSSGYIGGFVNKDQLVYVNADNQAGTHIYSTAGKKLKVIKKINYKDYTAKTKPYGFVRTPLVKQGNIYVLWDHEYAHNHILYHLKIQ